MVKMLETQAYLDTVCDLLRQGHTHIPVTVSGASMTPFLDPGDTVFLDLPSRPIEAGDVILFARQGRQYILHRVVNVLPDGTLELLGDAQQLIEQVRPDQTCAIVTSARHGEQHIDERSLRWRFFRGPWRHFRRSRSWINRIRNRLKR